MVKPEEAYKLNWAPAFALLEFLKCLTVYSDLSVGIEVFTHTLENKLRKELVEFMARLRWNIYGQKQKENA